MKRVLEEARTKSTKKTPSLVVLPLPVKLCQIRSDYRKSLPDYFIRIGLKIEQNCRLFLDIFGSAIMNDLFMTFTSRLKMDAKCVYQQ